MKQTSVFVTLLLYFNSMDSGAGSCNTYGPSNCAFQNGGYYQSTFCVWQPDAGFSLYYYKGNPFDFFAGLTDDKGEGKLLSRSACETGRASTHCLGFAYNFEQDDVIDLNVSIVIGRGNIVQPPTWTASRSYGWKYANVPINTESSFRVRFTARRRTGTQSRFKSVLIDNIYYWKSPCWLYPPDATPTTPVATMPTTPPFSMASTATNTTASTHRTTHNPLTPNPQTFHSNVSNIRSLVPEPSTKSESSSNKVGIIVGVIVAVLVVIAIVIAVLLVVLRKKHPQFWKTCCREKQPKEQFQMNAADNAAYTLDAYDSSHEVENHHARQNSDNHRLEAGSSAQASATRNYENQPSKPPSAPAYAEESQPRKDARETKPDSQRNPSTTVYEFCSVNEMNPTTTAGRKQQDLPPRATGQGPGEHGHYSTPVPKASAGYSLAQNTHGMYHTLEKESGRDNNTVNDNANSAMSASSKGPNGEYKSLDFDKKSCGAGGNTKGAAGAVYSHLNAGAEGTYSEVHRDKKEKVIDGVYSHTKQAEV